MIHNTSTVIARCDVNGHDRIGTHLKYTKHNNFRGKNYSRVIVFAVRIIAVPGAPLRGAECVRCLWFSICSHSLLWEAVAVSYVSLDSLGKSFRVAFRIDLGSRL